MEISVALRSTFNICSRPSDSFSRSAVLAPNGLHPKSVSFGSKSRASHDWNKQQFPSISHSRAMHKRMAYGNRKRIVVRASMSSSGSDSDRSLAPIAPLQLESPVGQFLSQILLSHPHLLPAAVEQQLEQLQTDRDAEKQKEDPTSSTDLVLYRRIAEVKENERKKALEEILYALIVQKFVEADVSLIPAIAPTPSSESSSRVDTWQGKEEDLVRLHSPEANEMIQNHLTLILGNRLGDSSSVAEISKLRVGQVYAASVIYGYFLRRVDQRFQLEKTMKVLSEGLNDEQSDVQQAVGDETRPSGSHPEASPWTAGTMPSEFGKDIKASKLRAYVLSFDSDTLKTYATIRSKEAVSLIEKHTEALFGRPEIIMTPQGTVDSSKDELLKISFSELRKVILEAVTFGSFLWDVESFVDSRYHFVMN